MRFAPATTLATVDQLHRDLRTGAVDGVLVVDEDADALEEMTAALEGAEFCPVTAASGSQALRLLDSVLFDVVVSDVGMPGVDGLSLLETVKDRCPRTEVLLVSDPSSREVADRARRQGACGVLEKPFPPERLVEAVRRAVLRARLRRLPGADPAAR